MLDGQTSRAYCRKMRAILGFLVLTCAVAHGLFPIVPQNAEAQVYDHLQCHRVKDSNYFRAAVVTLDALQDEFRLPADCVILKGKAVRFCVPTRKEVVDAGNAPVPAVMPATQDLGANDYLCYKIRCPRVSIADTVVTDQFGARPLVRIGAVQEICVPAVKGIVTTTTTTTSTTTTTTTLCTPDCVGKECGDDGCGGDCGTCSGLNACVVAACETLPCGGIAAIPCPPGNACIDQPGDNCAPACASSDCAGICVVMPSPVPPCGGIAQIPCASGQVCVDQAADGCHPVCGGADCGGICVEPPVQ